MIDQLLTGVWWLDVLALFGIAFLALLVFGIPVWILLSSLRWRRKDAADLALHAERIDAFRRASEVGNG